MGLVRGKALLSAHCSQSETVHGTDASPQSWYRRAWGCEHAPSSSLIHLSFVNLFLTAHKYSVTPVPTGLSKGLVRTEVAVINIPPRHFVHMQLTGSFDTTEVVVALTGGSWKRVELVGKLHRGLLLSRSKPYRKTIATP